MIGFKHQYYQQFTLKLKRMGEIPKVRLGGRTEWTGESVDRQSSSHDHHHTSRQTVTMNIYVNTNIFKVILFPFLDQT